MKIVQISMTAPYNDKWGYQENLLTKWQKKNGNDVTLITTRLISNKNDDGFSVVDKESFVNDDGVKVIRLDWLLNIWPFRTLRIYKNIYKTIEDEKPDFLFIHGPQFLDAYKVCKYLKNHPNVKAVVDNHADLTNSAKTFFPKLLHKTLWQMTAHKLNKYVEKFYGVLPIRCEFLANYYNLPKNRIDLLVMGADDDLIEEAKSNVNIIKEKFNINNSTFNIVCGGKFDHYKKEVLELMKAVNEMENLHLYVYGSIGDEIKEEFNNLLTDRITYVGWLSQVDSYSLLLSGNLAVFPGRHSVIWEQCVGLGVPLVVKKLPGTQHVNMDGNCIFLNKCDKQEIKDILNDVINNKNMYEELKKAATSDKMLNFRYSEIAKKSVEVCNN